MGAVVQDLRYGLKMLARHRGFTTIALITLVLGIGANSGLYTVMRTFLMGPYRLPNAHELVTIWCTRTDLDPGDYRGARPRTRVSAVDYLDWRDQAESFETIALFREGGYVLVGGERPERIRAVQATPGLLPMLGIEARIGRLFQDSDESESAGHVTVLTEPLWRRMFGASTEVLGQTVMLNDVPYTIIGVLEPEINRTMRWDDVDMWMPLPIDPAVADRGDLDSVAMARLVPGVTLEQAESELRGIAAGLAETYPDSNASRGIFLESNEMNAIVAEELLAARAMLAAVALVLIIACLNLATLFLVRTSARGREFAIRAALGAHRGRIVRQLLTESALLALIGGSLGLLLGNWGLHALALSMDPEALQSEGINLSMNTSVIVYTLLLSLGSALAFGLGPALRASKASVSENLKENAPSSSPGPKRQRLRNVLIVGQVMIVLPLLVSCGLAIRSAIAQSEIVLGFDPENVLTMRIDLPEHRYPESERRVAFFDELLADAAAVPGAEGVAVASTIPFSFYISSYPIVVEGREPPVDADQELVAGKSISPGYFEVLGTTLVRGRYFTEHDRKDSERVAIVNRRMTEIYWPGEDAIGKRLRLGEADSDAPWVTVVGVVEDTYQWRIDRPPDAELYVPYAQEPRAAMTLLARTAGDPRNAVGAFRDLVARIDPDQPVYDVHPMTYLVSQLIGGYDVVAQALGGLAAVAMTLAGLGLLGVISISVARRTHEIGVRMALGAQRGDVLRAMLRQGLGLVGVGLVVGLVVSLVAANVLASRFYGVSPRDPLVFLVSCLLLAVVGLLACYLPARRATKIDPAVALRYE